MIVRRFFEPALAQASYLIGCAAAGRAIVIDPHRDVEVYTRAAAADNLTIDYVTESHIHADFLSGTRELASVTGATMLLSDEGDDQWKYAYADDGKRLKNGDRIAVGNVTLEVAHTPGHTPEHITFVITDGAVADAPIAAATGDFIFVGDVGRPDLLERAANVQGTMTISARTLYQSLKAFDRSHEAWLQIWPGHGAGSACGKGISAVPHSTLGYERRFNWAFKAASEEDFITGVLAGQPDPPTYFATMKRMNKIGPRIVNGFQRPSKMADEELPRLIGNGQVVVDTRPALEFAAGFVEGTLNLPLTGSFVTWAGWLLPYDQPIYLVLGDGADVRLPEIVRSLTLIGLDQVAGYFAHSALAKSSPRLSTIRQIAVSDLAAMRGDQTPVVVDVRHEGEWLGGHVPSAIHIPLGHLLRRLSELPKGQPLVMQCQSGSRSAIAASLLRRAGYVDVSNLIGGFGAWQDAGLPTAK
jgi:hydroxyacylglutathione hydrolase